MSVRRKQLGFIHKSGGQASDDDLKIINSKYSLDALTADDIQVREFLLGHNGIDRDGDILDPALLKDFEKTLPGKGTFVRHPSGWDGDSGPGVGIWFKAWVETVSLEDARTRLAEPGLEFAPGDTKAVLLYGSTYIPKTKETKGLLKTIAAGVARYVSLGFSNENDETVKDNHGHTIATRLMAPGEAAEASLVWLGAQPGARATKSHKPDEENSMENDDHQKTVDGLKAKIKTLKAEAAALKALKDALGDAAGLLDDPQALMALITAAKEYRASAVNRLIKAERLLGQIDDSEEATKAAESDYASLPTAKVVALAKRLEKQIPSGSQLEVGDPNATGQPKTKTKTPGQLDMSDPVDNPLTSGGGY